MSVAEYCEQLRLGQILINHDYQRTSKVWPAAARSYLIDTILQGYPIPKFLLRQVTSLADRRTYKEVIDGQQRTTAIFDFFEDKLVISVGDFKGKRFGTLDRQLQEHFLSYPLSIDLFSGYTDEQVRQIFRRINSYTVPLNKQELRHATHQGRFKWFIVRMSERWADPLARMGVFGPRQLARMAESELLTEIIAAIENGIETAQPSKLDALYRTYDEDFEKERFYEHLLDEALGRTLQFPSIFRTSLVSKYNYYALVLALIHLSSPLETLREAWNIDRPATFASSAVIESNFGLLLEALEQRVEDDQFSEFVRAAAGATNTEKHRKIRFQWFCRALTEELPA